ncbi:MAG: NAD-dependent epimerase/dehydratase family protein [Kofleriaceae bacterium]|nr:NAD-dependent epimerase/dehydratase family protein [Kofleriaceae bacterium]
MSTVVVGGGRGFIGSSICRALAAAGHEAIAIGRGETARGDVLVWAAGKKLPTLEENRAVHVTAALEALAASGASKVIYVSSGECYGEAPLPWREDGPVRGTTPYAQAKLEGEQALSAKVPTVVLRPAVVYGPGQRPPMLLPSIVDALKRREHVALTDGMQTRDFVFVEDVATAVVAALGVGPTTINIGSGIEVRVREACETLGRLLDGEQLLGFGERVRGPGDPVRYVLAVERAAEVLGWRATTTLEVGLERLAASDA